MQLDSYIAKNGDEILYIGKPNLSLLDSLAEGVGDVWHSSLNQGYKNCFQDIMYQTAVFWWYINDFEGVDECICWRINPNKFAVRASVWKSMNGFDTQYSSLLFQGLDFGYNLLRNYAGIPLFVSELYKESEGEIKIPDNDRYTFFLKNFKKHHSYYMMFRKGIFRLPKEYFTFNKVKKHVKPFTREITKTRELKSIVGKPTVSLIIPTMKRQVFSQFLLNDHKNQSYQITEAVIVDATPEEERDVKFYNQADFDFKIKTKWQTTKGSCRARNEAMELCTGDYIIFADDDIRILPEFVENHIRLLQTYNAAACNGLDIMAKDQSQGISDLKEALAKMIDRWKVGVSPTFSNANSCVKREWVQKLIGNDINFDGGYGEDSDYGLNIVKQGGVLLHNPFSANLHLKPPIGGYRWWGSQSKVLGNKRKKQPWEIEKTVKYITPVPSPTITYGVIKHFTKRQAKEWRMKYFFLYLFKNDIKTLPIRILKVPYKQLQFTKSIQFAKTLIKLGIRYK